MNVQISFPVLILSRGHMSFFPDEEYLTTSNRTALKKGYFNGCLVIDSEGKSYSVNNAKQLHYVGPCWGWRWYSSREIKVGLEFEEVSQLTIEKLQQIVCEIIDQNSDYWSSTGDVEEIKRTICEASTFREIIEIIA